MNDLSVPEAPRTARLAVVAFALLLPASCGPNPDRNEQAAFRQILTSHLERYPRMELADLYKLVHQASMGVGHAIPDTSAARRWLNGEIATLAEGPEEPLFEPISPDGRLVRVHLRTYLSMGRDPDVLLEAFVGTASSYAGSRQRLRRYWSWARESAEAGDLPFDPDEMTRFIGTQAEQDYPAVHHSDVFREAYRPAYRVVDRTLLPEPPEDTRE